MIRHWVNELKNNLFFFTGDSDSQSPETASASWARSLFVHRSGRLLWFRPPATSSVWGPSRPPQREGGGPGTHSSAGLRRKNKGASRAACRHTCCCCSAERVSSPGYPGRARRRGRKTWHRKTGKGAESSAGSWRTRHSAKGTWGSGRTPSPAEEDGISGCFCCPSLAR